MSHPTLQDAAVSGHNTPVSVIVATKDRAVVLDGMFKTLFDQTVTPDEVIIVDQSTTDETRKLVAGLTEQAGERNRSWPHFSYLHVLPLGASAARNAGIDLSKSAILVFLDDDVLLEQSFFEELLKVYGDHPAVGAVSGIITNYDRPSFRQRFLDQWFSIGPFRDERLPLYWNANKLRQSEPIPIRKMSGGVMSVRRAALGKERFDASYRYAGEDVDLSWRLSESFPILLTPRARLKHLRTHTGPKREHWLASTVTAQYYLYYRLWNTSVKNFACFLWVNCGFIAVATVSSIRQRTLVPFRALLTGIKRARDLLAGTSAGERTGRRRASASA